MNNQPKQLNQWIVYGICLLISTIFFFLFGFNSPIYKFNSDHDYQWFMTMGNGLVHGKIPYRDLFEQKGPIVYFVTAFCCLFQNPGIVMLFIEILSMSLFLFFAFQICNKRLNTFYALLALPILAFAIFTSWGHLRSASTMEEFCLPIYTYFLLVWLEFLEEKKQWNWLRSLCLGLCFGALIWIKYTLLYFVFFPLLVWFFISLRRRQYRRLIINLVCMLIGALIITTPIIIFYLSQNALDDLFYVYFYINLTAYAKTTKDDLWVNFKLSTIIGPIFIILILFGVIKFSIKNWHNSNGRLLLTAFLINFILLVYSCSRIGYYYNGLIPYSILGLIYIIEWSSKYFNKLKKQIVFTCVFISCLVLCVPFSILTYELGRDKNEYVPLAVAEIINEYEKINNVDSTILCYKIFDYGFYNAAHKIPNNYYFARNVFRYKQLPELYISFEECITNQTCDFVITKLKLWQDEDLLTQYYKPYTEDITDCTFHYRKVDYFRYEYLDFILLIRK